MKTTTTPGSRDFNKATLRALARNGIRIIGITNIPGEGPMGYANGSRGYCLDDNGTHRIRSHAEVVALSSRSAEQDMSDIIRFIDNGF